MTESKIHNISSKGVVSSITNLDKPNHTHTKSDLTDATATKTAGKVPIADDNGFINTWIQTGTTTGTIRAGDDNRLDDTILTGTAGENLSLHNLVYLKSTDGKYYKADSSTETTSIVMGIVTSPSGIAQDSSGDIQIKPKFLTNNSWSWTYGDILYCGTAGSITTSWTTNAQPIGIAISANLILFTGSSQYSLSNIAYDVNTDLLSINYSASSYTPTVAVGTTLSVTDLGSHLHGIDLAIAAIVGRLNAHSI